MHSKNVMSGETTFTLSGDDGRERSLYLGDGKAMIGNNIEGRLTVTDAAYAMDGTKLSITYEDNGELTTTDYTVDASDDSFILSAESDTLGLSGKWLPSPAVEEEPPVSFAAASNAPAPDTANWMTNLPGHHRLGKFLIPGTHDSAAWNPTCFPNSARTQSRTIAQQLEDGIRFFDIRLSTSMGLFHGDIYLNYRFSNVMNDFLHFLAKHPKETVLVCIKFEKRDPNDETMFRNNLYEYITGPQYKDKWYTGTEVPTLDQVRGKLVLFRRFNAPAPIGIDLHNGWRDNDMFTLRDSANRGIDVQDCYCVYDWKYTAPKRARRKVFWIEEQVKKTQASRGEALALNFWSHQFTGIYGPNWYANEIQNVLSGTIDSYPRRRHYGIYIMDFYKQSTVNNAILSNSLPD